MPNVSNSNRADQLIKILLDDTESMDIKDDAAIALSETGSLRAEAALIVAILDPEFDEVVIATCAESLGELWSKRNHFDSALVEEFPLIAQTELLAITKHLQIETSQG